MFLRELFDQDNKTAVLAFGRMNPPTVGHKRLAEKISSIPGDKFIFLSQTQKANTDPLDFQTKVEFVKESFPGITVGDSDVRTVIQALQKLESKGYKNIVYVAGSDRLESFSNLINKYNGSEYNFNNIQVISAGERDPDADGAEGMSASKMRSAAASGNFELFAEGAPNKKIAENMYHAVRKGMKITESPQTIPPVTPDLLKKLEMYLDKLFATLRIDIEFTRHFLDRVNDERNVRQITIQELAKLFRDAYSKYGKKIAQMGPDAQAVIKDMATDINVPFVLNWDPRRQELDLVAKTVMRKKNFQTPNPELVV